MCTVPWVRHILLREQVDIVHGHSVRNGVPTHVAQNGCAVVLDNGTRVSVHRATHAHWHRVHRSFTVRLRRRIVDNHEQTATIHVDQCRPHDMCQPYKVRSCLTSVVLVMIYAAKKTPYYVHVCVRPTCRSYRTPSIVHNSCPTNTSFERIPVCLVCAVIEVTR
jgi:hypothetical protein